MVAWIALGVSIVVAGWNVYAHFYQRGDVSWLIDIGRIESNVPCDESTPWPWTIKNTGTLTAISPRLLIKGIDGEWKLWAGGPVEVEPGKDWLANQSAAKSLELPIPPIARIEYGVHRSPRRRTLQGPMESVGQSAIHLRKPRRRPRLKLDER